MIKLLSDEKIETLWQEHVLPGFGNQQKFISPTVFARAIEAAVLEAQAGQEPVAWAYTVNNSHSVFSAEKPPEDAYDEGTLYPLYAAPVVQPDILNDIDLILAGSHTEDCYAICGPGDETWVEEDKCNCAVGKARKLIAAAEGKSNAELNGGCLQPSDF